MTAPVAGPGSVAGYDGAAQRAMSQEPPEETWGGAGVLVGGWAGGAMCRRACAGLADGADDGAAPAG